MILEGSNPAVLAAQTIATQRDAQTQRAVPGQQTPDERGQASARARADRANAASAPQTPQAVEATETREQRVATDRDQSTGREESAPPRRASGRGQLVDIYA